MARRQRERLLKRLRSLPAPALLALIYAAAIAIGTVVLRLPVSHNDAVGWSESFFTATSAVTVTGLAVVDTGTDFTVFGQVVIMLLIQLGGLGLMVFAVLLLTSLGIPVGMPQRMILREELNHGTMSNLAALTRRIVKVAAVVEILGALLLMMVFVPAFGWAEGIWQAVFHSVSAFNNAGFGLHADSLSLWVSNPVINIVIPSMFIVSGLGFVVIGDIMKQRRWRTLSLHTKLMIVGTVALTVWGTVTFAFLEWYNPGTLGALSDPWSKVLAAWFQSVTTRTAGFNTVDVTLIRDETALMMMSLMLIGGGSTSTAGGIKVTTFIVLLLAVVAFFRRASEPHAFGRSIGADEVMKVLALTMISMMIVMISLFILLLAEDIDFLHLAFEVCSAFGTVGLTMGATPQLDEGGRLVIAFVMFLGRVGPLTLGFFLASNARPRIHYPDGQVYLG